MENKHFVGKGSYGKVYKNKDSIVKVSNDTNTNFMESRDFIRELNACIY